VLFRLKTPPPQDVRHYCRFPKCRSKLPQPVPTPRDAFCTRGCYSSFYRGHCLVCERRFERKTERAKVCGRRECRAAFRRDPVRFLGSRWVDATVVTNTAAPASHSSLSA
jgi:hypothetical protein